MSDGLKARHRAATVDILAANDRVERAVLFGSRATGSYRPASDVDIALYGDRLTGTDCARLGAAMEALTVPQRVDLVRHGTIDSDALREHIATRGVEWYRRGSGGPPAGGS